MRAVPVATPAPAPHGAEHARGTFLGLLAFLVSNLRSVFTLLVAWRLGQRGLGLYALAWAATDLASKLGTFGLDTAATTWVARDRSAGRAVLRLALRRGLLISAACAAGAALALLVQTPPAGTDARPAALALMLAALPAIALYRIANGVSRGLGDLQHDIYSRGLGESLVTIGAFLAALSAGGGDYAPSVAVVAGTAAAGGLAYALARRSAARADVSSPAATAGLLRFAAPVAGTGILNLLILRLDVLLLGAFVGRALTLEQLGVYCAAVEFGHGLRKLRQVFEPSFAPLAAEHAWRGRKAELYQVAGRASRWLLSIELPVVAVFLCAGGAVLSLYGAGFREGTAWLAVLALAQATNAFVGLAETMILAVRPEVALRHSLQMAAAQAALGLLLIPRWGALGAGLSVLVAYAGLGAVRYAELRRTYGWTWPWASARRPAVAFLAAIGAGLGARLLVAGTAGELAAVAACLSAYGFAWWWQGVDEGDRAVLAAVFARRQAA